MRKEVAKGSNSYDGRPPWAVMDETGYLEQNSRTRLGAPEQI